MDTINDMTNNDLQIIQDLVPQVTNQLFVNNIQGMLNDVISIIEKIHHISENLDKEERELVNQQIQYISIAMENKDYLLISDLLTYEMLPFINKLNKRSETNDNI